jgi:hypothetical protein
MRLNRIIAAIVTAGVIVAPGLAAAQHQHGSLGGHAGHGAPGMQMDQREVLVEGVRVIFQIMTNAEHKKMLVAMKSKEEPEAGTTHDIAVVLQTDATRKEILDAEMRLKLIDPKGQEQVKPLRFSKDMKSYDNYFTLTDKGRYQVIVAFKTGEKTMNAGIYYDMK